MAFIPWGCNVSTLNYEETIEISQGNKRYFRHDLVTVIDFLSACQVIKH